MCNAQIRAKKMILCSSILQNYKENVLSELSHKLTVTKISSIRVQHPGRELDSESAALNYCKY